jgi:hypothetical protein
MGARNRVGIGLSYRLTRATQPGGSGSLESILGLSFKNPGSRGPASGKDLVWRRPVFAALTGGNN